MITLIDNYDSFTYNLVHFLGELGAEVKVYRNNVVTVDALFEENPAGIVLSPGPCDPDRAGICLETVKRASVTGTPLLGVCLGHQTIGQVFGGKVVRADQLMHGKTSEIIHNGTGLFKGLPNRFVATRYHSLTIDPATVPNTLEVTATTDDGVIMGLSHKSLPLHGVQFHPESIASEHGHDLLRNFLNLTRPDTRAAA
ncbi:aminodeoxychorismate/anthranilate synthase component II [Sneathiella chungangensis]|uniref:Aminodeoxychorismate/anthranilate synthase component II n=1 Tax=Sneathiella chungangensis TaxID=1418234 RepID=A0A845MCQ3_9PROT|nr:aminodeoxychorismate/anthranilate synthase component II [Sneathiella chungangensis]MZR20967.1 aminodeoxychorismate/anthranilate synthase component II [Sneathiella chungangensis]